MYTNFDGMISPLEIAALVAGGFAAGLINTLAGNGSAITLPLLMSFGMDANAANATNRVGALFQTISAMGSLPKTQRTRYLIRESRFIVLPIVLGSIGGAFLAIDLPENILRLAIGFVMIVLLLTLLLNPKKWLIATDGSKRRKTPLVWLSFFALGVYGGFIQIGFGIFFLSLGVLMAKYALRDANIMKLFLALIMTVPAFAIFAFGGAIEWIPGLSLAAGTSLGARFGTRKVITHPKANAVTRYVLIGVILIAIVKMFQPYITALIF